MPGRGVRVHQAGARRGMVAGQPEHRVPELQVQHDPAVSQGHVRSAVTVDPPRAAVQRRVLDHAEQVDGHRPQRGHADPPADTP
jgi:hypothetical protein